MTSILLLAVMFFAPQTASTDQLTTSFRERDQKMLDAIAPGDAKVWEAVLAPDAVYVDENGRTISRADFMKEFTPLPPGATGTIKIKDYSLALHGDTATVIHTDDEEENYHGQVLHAQYIMTETWKKIGDDWKLLLVHAYAVLHDPPAVTLSTQDLDSYAGKYTAGDLTYTIKRDGDHLVGSREGRPPATLQAEVRDVFFIAGQPRTRKIFQRNVEGKITGFVDRREGIDLVWTRAN